MKTAHASKRRDKDITKLMMSNYDVILVNEDKLNELYVMFEGPKDSPYENVSFLVIM